MKYETMKVKVIRRKLEVSSHEVRKYEGKSNTSEVRSKKP